MHGLDKSGCSIWPVGDSGERGLLWQLLRSANAIPDMVCGTNAKPNMVCGTNAKPNMVCGTNAIPVASDSFPDAGSVVAHCAGHTVAVKACAADCVSREHSSGASDHRVQWRDCRHAGGMRRVGGAGAMHRRVSSMDAGELRTQLQPGVLRCAAGHTRAKGGCHTCAGAGHGRASGDADRCGMRCRRHAGDVRILGGAGPVLRRFGRVDAGELRTQLLQLSAGPEPSVPASADGCSDGSADGSFCGFAQHGGMRHRLAGILRSVGGAGAVHRRVGRVDGAELRTQLQPGMLRYDDYGGGGHTDSGPHSSFSRPDFVLLTCAFLQVPSARFSCACPSSAPWISPQSGNCYASQLKDYYVLCSGIEVVVSNETPVSCGSGTDSQPSCATWANQGLCSGSSSAWMLANCAKSCNPACLTPSFRPAPIAPTGR